MKEMNPENPSEKVVLVEYQKSWADDFKQIKQKIGEATSSTDIAHIGSTAVEGLAAKEIIDIQLGVADLSQVQSFQTKLKMLGLQKLEKANRDHIPFRPIEETSCEWEKAFFFGEIEGMRVNLHIRKVGNPNWRFALLVRDFLRENSSATTAYQQFKLRLSSLPISKFDYVYTKDPVVDLIYLQAEVWAKTTNWKWEEK